MEETEVREPVSLEIALSWLATARPTAVLALLRDPEFAFISMTAFAGFRVNATGYANPLVRRRLAQEIVQNELFAGKVQALAEVPAPSALSSPAPRPNETPGLGAGGPGAIRDRTEELRTERDQRRRERDEARDALRRVEADKAKAEAAQRQAEGERDAQVGLAQQQTQRIARLDRQIARMQAEQAALLKALRQDKVSARPRAAAPTSSSSPTDRKGEENVWTEAVRHLLHKGKHDAALALALDVLRAVPDELTALDIAAQAHERRGERTEAIEITRRLLTARLARGEVTAGTATLIRLLLLLPAPSDAGRDVRHWLSYLRPGDEAAITGGRAALERLRGLSPVAHTWLAAEVAGVAPALAEELMPPPGALGPDDPLPLPLSGSWTARGLVDAVNANREQAVTAAREVLSTLDAGTSERVWAALARAAEADDSALLPLRRTPRGPAVVDGSNAAWFDQHSYAAPRARLRPVLELRRALRRRGFFPVVLYADAPLPYTVDDPDVLRAMLGRGELTLVDSGVDADEILLREAKRYGAPLVTNDYMTDWDPEALVEKIQYTISLTGEAHLLS